MTAYFVKSGTGGTDAGTNWANAAESIPGLMTAQALAGGDIIYVHNTHNYLAGAAITWTLPESGTGTLQVLCVDGGDATGASLVGSTVGALTTGAVESTNGNSAFTISTNNNASSLLYVHGITIKTGAGGNSSGADITIVSNSGHVTLNACTIWTDSTNTGAVIAFGPGGSAGSSFLAYNTSLRFGATGQTVTLSNYRNEFRGCSINASGSSPTTLFSATTKVVCFCSGCDWSLATNVINQATVALAMYYMTGCTIGTPTTGTHGGIGAMTAEFHACAAVDGSNGANVLAYYKEDAFGIVQDDQTVYVTSSPAQGTQDDGTATSYSLKMTPSALAFPWQPLYTPWAYVKVASTGSKTISIKVADTEGALLKDAELWMQVEYMGGVAPADSPQAALEGTYPLAGTYQDVTAAGSNLTDTGEAWTGITETGTYTLSKTVTVDEQGYLRCRVGLGKDTTNPVYVDMKISVA